MSSATDSRILCYVTDRKSLAMDTHGNAAAGHDGAASHVEIERARIARLLAQMRVAISAGANWIQIREKDLSANLLFELTQQALAVAQASATRVIVNDRLDVAIAASAGGVHLGHESLPVTEVAAWREKERAVRPVLQDFLIGASCHSIAEAKSAESGGADYIIFGPVFATPSKEKYGAPRGINELREVSKALKIPVIAIGGINSENQNDCFQAGAKGIAAIRRFQ